MFELKGLILDVGLYLLHARGIKVTNANLLTPNQITFCLAVTKKHYFYSALDKLLGQLGTYAIWLSSIAYLQKQLRIFKFFTPRFFL